MEGTGTQPPGCGPDLYVPPPDAVLLPPPSPQPGTDQAERAFREDPGRDRQQDHKDVSPQNLRSALVSRILEFSVQMLFTRFQGLCGLLPHVCSLKGKPGDPWAPEVSGVPEIVLCEGCLCDWS